jgi:phenylpropionate dioxygenase-like ring-hydroxylating dioxygenase large terminal subunit
VSTTEPPVVAGLSADVREPGAFTTMVCDGVAVLTVRGDDGVLRAFRDACRHREPLVVAERESVGSRATAAALSCPFAGWPDAHDTAGRLRPLAVAETHGVVLVRIGGPSPIDVDDVLDAATVRTLEELALDRYSCVDERRDVRRGDWRDAVDALPTGVETLTVAGHAVVVARAGSGEVELHRAFATPGGDAVVDHRRYALTA